MPPTHRSTSPLAENNKRLRTQHNKGGDGSEVGSGNKLSEAAALLSIEPLPCSEEPEQMKADKVTEYMLDLPATTQHYDMKTLFGLPAEDVKGWGDYVAAWKNLRGYHVNYLAMIEKAPFIRGGARAPPISPLKLRLRAVVTYKDLLTKAKERDAPAEITLELARKLLDYLILCFARASVEAMKGRMPDYDTTFSLAAETIKDHLLFAATRTEGNKLSESHSRTNSISVGVGQQAQPENTNFAEEIDRLKIVPAELTSHFKRWDSIAGNTSAKKALYEAVVWSEKLPRAFPQLQNVLLFGPPGTGKTMMVKCLAAIGGWNVFDISLSSFKGKYAGESEKNLDRIYARAVETSPSIVFFDEVDALMANRTESQTEGAGDIKTCLLKVLTDIADKGAKVMTIAATTRPHAIDFAFLQRFEKCIYVPLPDVAAAFSIIQTQLQEYHHDPFLDTAQGRNELKLLAGRCIKGEDKKKRWLSGHDIDCAMKSIMKTKRAEIFKANDFEEQIHRDGVQVLMPCAPKVGAIKRKLSELNDVDLPRVNISSVNLSDVAAALSSVRSKTSATHIMDLDEWNRQHGSQWK